MLGARADFEGRTGTYSVHSITSRARDLRTFFMGGRCLINKTQRGCISQSSRRYIFLVKYVTFASVQQSTVKGNVRPRTKHGWLKTLRMWIPVYVAVQGEFHPPRSARFQPHCAELPSDLPLSSASAAIGTQASLIPKSGAGSTYKEFTAGIRTRLWGHRLSREHEWHRTASLTRGRSGPYFSRAFLKGVGVRGVMSISDLWFGVINLSWRLILQQFLLKILHTKRGVL